MKRSKSLFSILACTLLIFSLTGCQNDSSASISTVSESDISSALFNWYLVEAYDEACTIHDGKDELFTSQIEGKDTETWIREQAVTLYKKHFAVENEFESRGLSLSDEDSQTIDNTVEQYWDAAGYSSYYESKGVDEEAFRAATANDIKRDMLFEDMKEELTASLTDQALSDYFDNHYAMIKYIAFPYNAYNQSTTGDADSDTIDYDTLFEEYQNRIQGDSDFNTAIDEIQADDKLLSGGVNTSKIISNVEEGTSSETVSIPSDPYATIVSLGQSGFPEAFLEGLFDQEYGIPLVYDDTSNLYQIIYERLDISGETEVFESLQDEIRTKMGEELFEEKIAELAEPISTEEIDDVINQDIETKFTSAS